MVLHMRAKGWTVAAGGLARSSLAAGLLVAGLALGGVAQAQTLTRPQLQEIYQNFLVAEGYRPEITNAGNVRFKREGRSYLISIDERDPTFFRMTFAMSGEDKSPEARQRRLEAASLAASETKAAKVFLDDEGDPVFAVEFFQVAPGDATKHFARLISCLELASSKYLRKFRGE